jgi:hypothetical protein
VKVNQEFPIHKFFCFPTAIFGIGGSYIFCEKDEGYKKYELTEEQFKEKVIETVQEAEAPSALFEERDPLVAVYEPTP